MFAGTLGRSQFFVRSCLVGITEAVLLTICVALQYEAFFGPPGEGRHRLAATTFLVSAFFAFKRIGFATRRNRDAGNGEDDEARKAHQPDDDSGADRADRVAQVAADDEVGGDPAPARIPGEAADGAERTRVEESVPERRDGTGEDMFSQICRTRDDDGNYMSVEAIVDHMNFLMMAAHDTTTSSITTMVSLLGRHPEWHPIRALHQQPADRPNRSCPDLRRQAH